MTVYLHYTKEELDRQYRQETLVPDYEKYFVYDAKQSRAYRASHPCHLDIAYGSHPDERLDIFSPPHPDNSPVLLYCHGGGWKYQSKNDVSYIGKHFNARGAFHIPVNYTLAPDASLSHMHDQLTRALHWIETHIASYGGDPARIYVAGHSAGAHLAANLLPFVRGGLLISGIYDLIPVKLSFRDDYLYLSDDEIQTLSPIHTISPLHPPIVLAYSDSELPEFQRQSQAYAEAYQTAGNACTLHTFCRLDHFETLLEFEKETSPPIQSMFRLMKLA